MKGDVPEQLVWNQRAFLQNYGRNRLDEIGGRGTLSISYIHASLYP